MSDQLIQNEINIIQAATSVLNILNSRPTLTTYAELQTFKWEMLWGVGRSKPVDNPKVHGQATFTPGHPTVLDFKPVVIPNDSDNLYTLLRMANRIPLDLYSKATKVKYALSMSVSDITAPQAVEFECQRQVGMSIQNMAWQLLPSAGQLKLRAFDYKTSTWAGTGIIIDAALISGVNMMDIVAEFTLSPTETVHESITINGTAHQVGLSQAAVPASISNNYFNIAVQTDSNSAAKPYKLNLEAVSLSIW